MKIDSYSFGYMSVNGRGYSSDLIIYPDGRINASWWRKQGHMLLVDDLDRLGEVRPEVVIIGTGANNMMRVQRETEQYLRSVCRQLIVENTGDAVRLFNRLSPGREVAGLFHLTC